METRRILAIGVVVLALAACLGYKSAVARPARKGSAAEAPRRAETGAKRSPSFLLPSRAANPAAAAAAPAPEEPALGAWTVEDALEGLRRPDTDDEVSVLRETRPDVPAEAAEVFALAATDRGHHDALARASEAAADGRTENALTALESALAEAPSAHRVARVQLLESMVTLSRSVRGLAERRALAARLADERAKLVEVASRAGMLDADGAARARGELARANGLADALDPVLAALEQRRGSEAD